MKMTYIIKWMLAIMITGLLLWIHVAFPAFPEEILPLIGLAVVLVILKFFQRMEE